MFNKTPTMNEYFITRVIIVFLVVSPLTTPCIASEPEDYRENWCSSQYPQYRVGNDLIVIKVSATIERRSNGTGGRTIQEVEDSLATLNNALEGAGIEFRLVEPILYVDDDDLYNDHVSAGIFRISDDYNYLNDRFNILYQPSDMWAEPSFLGIGSNILVLATQDYWSDWLEGWCEDILDSSCTMFIHEVGHCLGLWHPWQFSPTGFFGPWDETEEPWDENDPCYYLGDYVCDTPSSPDIDYGRPRPGGYILGSAAPDCLYTYPDPVGDCDYQIPISPDCYHLYRPDMTNYMEYAVPGCRDHFTEGQFVRMRACVLDEFVSLGIAEIESTVRYENTDAASSLDYTGTPYSSALLDFSNYGLIDMFISVNDGLSHLYECIIMNNGVPNFESRRQTLFSSSDSPQSGLHGVAVADYDNDGSEDIFVGADMGNSPRFYRFNSTIYEDVASEVGLLPYANDAWSAAWVDYDRDGWVDLVLGRAEQIAPGYGPNDFLAKTVYLLKNDVSVSGAFIDRTVEAGLNSITGAFLGVTCADVNADSYPDIFLSNILDETGSGTSSSYLLLNNGDGTFDTANMASRFPRHDQIQGISGATFADFDNDGDFDLTLSSQSVASFEPWILFNDGTGHFNQDPHIRIPVAGRSQGHAVLDHDLDGTLDLLLLPESETDHPWLFSNVTTTGGRIYTDVSESATIADIGKVDGVSSCDWNYDGDPDIYLGRQIVLGSEDYFFKAKSGGGLDTPDNPWIGFRLVATGANNGSCIGAEVTISYDDKRVIQVVGGGSARGGQRGPQLVYGLGEWTEEGGITVEVLWPNGLVQNVGPYSLQDTGIYHYIHDMTNPGVIEDYITCKTKLTVNGDVEWTISWTTEYLSRGELDRVEIWGPGFNDPSVFYGEAGSITRNEYGTYDHEVKFTTICSPGVHFPYDVSSSTDVVTSVDTTYNYGRVPLCLTQ